MDLSDGQFQEHLDAFHEQLGLEFGRNYLRTPGGLQVPTVQQSVDIRGTPAGTARYMYATVPAESGGLHSMTARLIPGADPAYVHGGQPQGRPLVKHAALDFNMGRHAEEGSAWYQPGFVGGEGPAGRAAEAKNRDPERFDTDVQNALRRSVPPSPEGRAENAGWMKKYQETGGLITVKHEPVYNQGNRYYHFNVGTGRLTER